VYQLKLLIHRSDRSVGIATRHGLEGPGIESRWGARFSAPVQTGPEAHSASYTMGTGSFPGVKRPGRGVDRPPLSSAHVKERVELYLSSPFEPSWPVLGWTLLYLYRLKYVATMFIANCIFLFHGAVLFPFCKPTYTSEYLPYVIILGTQSTSPDTDCLQNLICCL